MADIIHNLKLIRKLLRVGRTFLKGSKAKDFLKMLPVYVRYFEEYPPDQFLQNMLIWSKSFGLIQSNHYYAKLNKPYGLDEYLTGCLFTTEDKQHKDKIDDDYPKNPKICIVTTIRDGNIKIMTSTFGCIEAQTYNNWEYRIICEEHLQDTAYAAIEASLSNKDRVSIESRTNVDDNFCKILNKIVIDCTGDFIVFLSEGDQLTQDAFTNIVHCFNQFPHAALIYSDEACLVGEQVINVFFKPGWSPDLLFSINYVRNLFCCRKETISALGGFHGVLEEDIKYDMSLRIAAVTGELHHIPKVLYHEYLPKYSYASRYNSDYSIDLQREALKRHIHRIGIKGEVQDGIFKGSFRVHRRIAKKEQVSILIPVKDKLHLLQRCIRSIEEKTTYTNYEIIIIDNGSSEAEMLHYLDQSVHQVIDHPGPFNFAKINNFAASHASGKYLLFMNNDTELINGDWLDSMVEQAQRQEVGIVGAKLLYPNGLVQHAGMILARNQFPDHLHRFIPVYDHGPYGMADVIRNYNMVTGACMMIRANVFKEVEGFDENFPIIFNDVDLCFKVRARGYLIVYTPYAVLYHYEGISRWLDEAEFVADRNALLSRWGLI